MKHPHHGLFLRVILLSATILFGAGLFAASNYYRGHTLLQAAAVVPLAQRDYNVSLPTFPSLWRDPLSMDETLGIVGGWGCRLHAGMPYSMLHYTHCF
jgi:hypothetical protein